MKQDIRLYLAGQRADLATDPKILFNYKVTDTQNPTAVKNNFTKGITLDGTDRNNAIFGEIYDLSRLQTYAAGEYAGTDFNPLRKADFALYIDSECYERGYFKLNEITKTGGRVSYSITLYGGLGEFLYNLEESSAGNKREFKDLKIVHGRMDAEPVEDLGFHINKETVASAWDNIDNPHSRYSTVNFAPCYNGAPEDFTADAMLLNLNGKPYEIGNITGFTSVGGWAKGDASRNLTEWETRDLRSYLQRPVLKVSDLIESCCLPENNGGYDVDLDSHFFSESNPYYGDAWVTCRMIKDLQGTDDSSASAQITGATIEGGGRMDRKKFYDIETDADFSEFSNLSMDLIVNATPDEQTTEQRLYLSNETDIDNNITLQNRFIKDFYHYYSAFLMQLVAYDELGRIVATSAAYHLTSKLNGSWQPDFRDQMDTKECPIPEWKMLYGYFEKTSTGYTWCDMNGNPQRINFRFPAATSFYKLKLRFQRPYMTEYKWTGLNFERTKITSATDAGYMWPSMSRKVQGNHELHYYTGWGVLASQALEIGDFTATATRYGGFLSGKYVPQERILTLGVTPAQFLLSYIKLFGLHIWKDPIERKVYIADRETFYMRHDVRDIEEFIDRSKAAKVTPQVAQTRWYDFNTEQNDSEANAQYLEEYGTDFGLQRVNTSYDFDAGITNVYDGCFKGGVQVLESSPYYHNDYNDWPVFVYNGFKVTSYTTKGTELEGTEQNVNTETGVNAYPVNDRYAGFDLFDKPQFHTGDNAPSEGSMTLLFFNGFETASSTTGGDIKYFLTDDIEEMVTLNAKQPCWIITETGTDWAGNTIGVEVDELPHFSRYKVYKDNGYITHTWDFGRTQETYIPDTVLTEGSSIYEKCWKDYISDVYDVNGRILKCYCLIRGQVNPDWLRRFYWFDNSLWRLNVLKEYDPGAYGTTSCEFLKVQDLDNYSLEMITNDPVTRFYLPDYIETGHERTKYTYTRYYTIPNLTSAVTVDIEVQDGGLWYFGDGPGANYSIKYDDGTTQFLPYSLLTETGNDRGYGTTQETFKIGYNQTGTGRTYTFNIVIYGADGDHWYYIVLRQESGQLEDITVSRLGDTGNVVGEGESIRLIVSSTSPWSAQTTYPYATLDKYSGYAGNTTVVMTVEQNDSTTTPRSCRATFTNEGGSQYIYSIIQNPYGLVSDLIFSADTTQFAGYVGGTINAHVGSPENLGDWQVVTCPDWITVSPSSGESGITHITLTADANAESTPRYADVTIKAGGQTSTVAFTQPAAPGEGIKITLPTFNFGAHEASYRGTVYSSEDGWTFMSSSWLATSIQGGNSGITPFVLRVAQNKTGYGRLGYLRATSANYTEKLALIQDEY